MTKAAYSNIVGGRRKKKEEEDLRTPGWAPWLATGLGAGALGTAYGLGSDKQWDDAVSGFKRMHEPLGPSDTMLNRYGEAMSGAAALKPFGMPVSELMPLVRQQGWIMGKTPLAPGGDDNKGGIYEGLAGALGEKNPVTQFLRKGVGIPGYTADTPALFHGARQHYGQFARGPIAAVSHMMSGPRRGYKLESPELTVGGDETYKDYFAPKFEEFVLKRTGMLPNEVDLQYLPKEEQVKLLQDFHGSLTPAEQAEKSRIETGLMGNLKSENTRNYEPIVEGVGKARNLLKDYGMAIGGSGVGGLAGHHLYRALTDDDEESWLGNTLSTGSGMALGGLGGLMASERGRGILNNLLSKIQSMTKTSADPTYWQRLTGQAPTTASGPISESVGSIGKWLGNKIDPSEPGYVADGVTAANITGRWGPQKTQQPFAEGVGYTPGQALNNMRYGRGVLWERFPYGDPEDKLTSDTGMSQATVTPATLHPHLEPEIDPTKKRALKNIKPQPLAQQVPLPQTTVRKLRDPQSAKPLPKSPPPSPFNSQ